jgi:hypothetical protein
MEGIHGYRTRPEGSGGRGVGFSEVGLVPHPWREVFSVIRTRLKGAMAWLVKRVGQLGVPTIPIFQPVRDS